MILQVGVKALLRNKEGRYLLVRRSTEKYRDVPPSWDIPGGRINAGTPLLENLRREVREETGLELKGAVRLITAQDIFTKDGERHVVRLTYTGEIEGEPVLDEENTDYMWARVEEMMQMSDLDSYLREAIRNI